MNVSRRNFILGGAATAALSGCRFVPTPDQGKVIGKGVGGATGLVMDPCVSDNDVRNAIVEVAERIGRCAPQEGETVREAWTRIANAHVKELIDAGKITQVQGAAIIAAFKLLLAGWAILEARHPQVKVWSELTVAVIGGFCEGFLAVFKPANEAPCDDCTVDPKAYKALRNARECYELRFAAGPAKAGSR